MHKLVKATLLLFFGYLSAQKKSAQTVYFDFDKYSLYDQQIQTIIDFVKKIDVTKVESIQIYGYCDDRGDNDYNYELSKNRVKTVQNILTSNGFSKIKLFLLKEKDV